MSKESLYKLAGQLRPYIEGEDTILRSAVDVKKQVALTLYYLGDDRKDEKNRQCFRIISPSCIENRPESVQSNYPVPRPHIYQAPRI